MNLESILPAERIKSRLIDRIAYASDASYFRLIPQAAAQPNSIDEIKALFQFSQRNKVPMTFRAAGTSLSGQAVTNGILVDVSKHWGEYSIDEKNHLIHFQPGIVGGFLNNALKPYKRRIGPDPASIDACMMGGILANNSSGMCCGVTENSYQTIHSMTFVLPNGFVLNTNSPAARLVFENEQPHIAKGLRDLKTRILSSTSTYKGETLAARIKRRYQTKNTNGYLLNAFLDFEHPLDILIHLLIGSEGTLGFIANAALRTLPDFNYKYTGQLYFKNIRDAAAAIYPIKQSGARAAEMMDRASLRSVENNAGAPPILKQLPDGATAILVEYQAEDLETMRHFEKESARLISTLKLIHDVEFTSDPAAQAALWKPRKGIIASAGSMRPAGTTFINEDVAFPVENLAEAVMDLRHIMDAHGYDDGVIFGHAKDGNLHFSFSQRFNTEADQKQFDAFIRDMVKVVSGKHDGALKAEHGTGRNMAPFVETEWGAEAYAVMRDLKDLLDPDHMLNPGVILNDDPQAHASHLKSLPLVADEIDKCIECGFCESKCPSRRLTLTPRQRIVVQRELARLQSADSSTREMDSLSSAFAYDGVDTCALDGLCATACPVGINTGQFIKRLRTEKVKNEAAAKWIVNHFEVAEKAVGMGVRLGHAAEKIIGANGVKLISIAAEKITRAKLPKWNRSIPKPPKKLPRGSGEEKDFIYFPSCVSRQLGSANSEELPLSEAFLAVASRANIKLHIPAEVEGNCCGMPFSSKGYKEAYQLALHKTLMQFWEWSDKGKYPIVIDTTSCAHTIKTCGDDLSDEDRMILKELSILDGVEFLHDVALPKLDIKVLGEDVVLHPNCSARKLGLEGKMRSIATQCARRADVPLELGCCAFAGDRGLLLPELTKSAAEKEAREVQIRAYDGYYSSNIPCEIGMSEATGKNYRSIVYLVEKASRRSNIV